MILEAHDVRGTYCSILLTKKVHSTKANSYRSSRNCRDGHTIHHKSGSKFQDTPGGHTYKCYIYTTTSDISHRIQPSIMKLAEHTEGRVVNVKTQETNAII